MSFILNLYKGKGDALNRGNYRGLKLTEHVMKVMERIVDGMIREMIAIDEMQFAFVPGRGTTDAIFIIRQLQEKFLSRKDFNDKNLTLFFGFVDLEKAFDRVPRKVLWWTMRKVGVEEWIVRLVQAMYNNARSRVRVGSEYSEEFEVGVGVHQGSVLSPLLFIIVLEALSRDFRVGVPWELFFADDLVIIATSLEGCVERVKAWKEGLESKGLHVNMTKTKFMASGLGLDILQDSGKFPCAVCRTGVGRSSIRCSKCNLWVHYKKCSGLKTLSEDLSYECRAANQYGISIFCTDFTCKIREYEFGLENTEIELCQFCHLKYCCQNKAYLFWVANQSGFVAFYALEPSNTSLITKTFKLLSSTCSSNMLSCITSCSCSTGSIH